MWFNDDAKDIINERRAAVKDRTRGVYNKLNEGVIAGCRIAKDKWLGDKCRNIEELDSRHNIIEKYTDIRNTIKQTRKMCKVKNKYGAFCRSDKEISDPMD